MANPFATLGKKKSYSSGGGESSCGSSGEGTCGGGGSEPPESPAPPATPTTSVTGEDAPQFPGTLGVAPSTQALTSPSLDFGGLAALMAKMAAGQGSTMAFGGQGQSLPNQANRGKDNYLDGMSRTWR